MKTQKESVFKDFSLWSLIIANVVTTILAIVDHWSLINIMWVYWGQSILIGVFSYIKTRLSNKVANDLNNMFLGFYLFFNSVYLIFLIVAPVSSVAKQMGQISSVWLILFAILVFFVNHLFSFFYNRKEVLMSQSNREMLVFFPILRVVPMHIAIVLGAIISGMLPLFLILKTVIDVIMHIIQHKFYKQID